MLVFIDFLWLLAGLVALYLGADWMVKGAAKIAVKFGISSLVIGLTVVAFGTSAPELFVSIGFNHAGEPDMAIGNVVGSNICNIALVLGVSAFICVLHIKTELLLRDLPLLLISSLVFSWMVSVGAVSRVEGVLLFLAVIAYTVYQLFLAKKVKNPEVVKEFEDEFGCKEGECNEPMWKLSLLVLLGLVALYFGAEWLKTGGVGLATWLGVPKAVIALILISFATSVPELATSIVASLKNEGDIITGNVVGSCIFNILCVMGITAGIKPMTITAIETSDLIVMVILTAILIPFMWSGRKISRFEGSILLLSYLGYCVFLWFDRIAA